MLTNTYEPRPYRSIEGMDAKMPFIEIWARMTGDLTKEDTNEPVSIFSNNQQNDPFFGISQEFDCKYTCCHPLQFSQEPKQLSPFKHVSEVKTSDDHSTLFYLNLESESETMSEHLPIPMTHPGMECEDVGGLGSGMRKSSNLNLLDPLPYPGELYADLVKALKETPPGSLFMKDPTVRTDARSHADFPSQEEMSGLTDEVEPSQQSYAQSYATDNTLWRASMSNVSSIEFPVHDPCKWIPDQDLAGIAIARGLIEDYLTFPSQSEDDDADDESESQPAYDSDDSEGGCPLNEFVGQEATRCLVTDY